LNKKVLKELEFLNFKILFYYIQLDNFKLDRVIIYFSYFEVDLFIYLFSFSSLLYATLVGWSVVHLTNIIMKKMVFFTLLLKIHLLVI